MSFFFRVGISVEVNNLFAVVCLFFLVFSYAHIEVAVTLVVVNFFGLWAIARYPTVRLSRKLEEKLRTGLLDLPKPLRTLLHLRKP